MRRTLLIALGMVGMIVVPATSSSAQEQGAGGNLFNGGLDLDVRPKHPKESDTGWKEGVLAGYLHGQGHLTQEQIATFVKWAVHDRKMRVASLYWLGENFVWLVRNQPVGPGYNAKDALALLKTAGAPTAQPRTLAELGDIQGAWLLYARWTRTRSAVKDSEFVRKLYSAGMFTSVFEEAVKTIDRDWEAERVRRAARLTFLRERLIPTDGVTDNRQAPDFDKWVAETKQLQDSKAEWQKQYSDWRKVYCEHSSDFWITPLEPQMPDERGNPSVGSTLLPNCRYDVAKMVWSKRPPPWGHQQEIENAQRDICTTAVLTAQESLRETIVKNYRIAQRYRDLQNLCNCVSRQIESNAGLFAKLAGSQAFADNTPPSEPATVLLLRLLLTSRGSIRAMHRESMRLERAVGGASAPDTNTAATLKSLHELILVQIASFDSLQYLSSSLLIEPELLKLTARDQPDQVRVSASGQLHKQLFLGFEDGSSNTRWRTLASALVAVAVQPAPDGTIVYSAPGNIDFRFNVSVGGRGPTDLADYVRSLHAQYSIVRTTLSQSYPRWEQQIKTQSVQFQQQAAQNFSAATSRLQQRSAQSAAQIDSIGRRTIALSIAAKVDYLKQAAVPYEFQRVIEGASLATVPGQPGKDLASLHDKIAHASASTPDQASLKECGEVSLAAAALAYFKGEAAKGQVYGYVGEAVSYALISSDKLKEFSLRLLPQGWVIDAFEAITGKDMDGRALTPLERGLVVFGASAGAAGETKLASEALEALSRAYSRTATSVSRFAESSGIAKVLRTVTGGGPSVKGAQYVHVLPELTGSLKEAFFHRTVEVDGVKTIEYAHIVTGEYKPGELLFQAQKSGQAEAGHWFIPAKPINPSQAEEWTNIEKWGKTADKIVLYRVKERVSGYAGLVDGAKVPTGPQVLSSTGHQFFIPYDVPLSDVIEQVRVFTKDGRGFFVP